MQGTNPTADVDPEAKVSWLSRARQLIAVVVLAGAAALVLLSHYSDRFDVCETQATQHSVITDCGPLPVSEVLPLILLGLVFLLPDLSSFEIAGLVRVVRKLDEGQQRLERGQDALVRQLTEIRISNQNQFAPQLQVNLSGLASEARAVIEHDPTVAVEAPKANEVADRFESVWLQLRPWSDLVIRLNDPMFVGALSAGGPDPASWSDAPGLSPGDRELLQEIQFGEKATLDSLRTWAGATRDRLELVRRARASGEVPESAYVDATVVAADLLKDLRERGLSQDS